MDLILFFLFSIFSFLSCCSRTQSCESKVFKELTSDLKEIIANLSKLKEQAENLCYAPIPEIHEKMRELRELAEKLLIAESSIGWAIREYKEALDLIKKITGSDEEA